MRMIEDVVALWAFSLSYIAAGAMRVGELAFIEGGSELNLLIFPVYDTGLVFYSC